MRGDSALTLAIRGLIILIVVVALLVILFKLIDHL